MNSFYCDMTSLTWLRLREPIHHNPKKPPKGGKKKQRKQTTTITWTLFIKIALLSQPLKDCMAQLKAREDLSVLLGVLLFLPYVSKDNHFVCLVYYTVPIPALASQGGSKQDLCTEGMKIGVLLLAVVLIQHSVGCALQL